MTVEMLEPEGMPRPIAHYSLGTRVGDRIYVAGVVPLSLDGTVVAPGSPGEQMRYVCERLRAFCAHYGAGLENVATCLVYLTDRDHFREADAAFAEVFGDHRPARATVVAELVDEAFLVELASIIVELPRR